MTTQSSPHSSARRQFLKTVAVSAAATSTARLASAQAEGSDKIKVGLVGCGGRGTGAAKQALNADPGTVLHAAGDAFEPNLTRSLQNLHGQFPESPEKLDVPPERQFVGMDAFKDVIASGVDLVICTTPPGFRPQHMRAAIEAGKHVFVEKPMAVDLAGVRSVIESAKMAKEKNLAVGAGFCWRYHDSRRPAMQRVHDGEIGDITSIFATYYTGPVKPHPGPDARPDGMGDVEWQIRNWYNFSWLSGDGLAEQACHSVDKMSWAMQDIAPVHCIATGGRQIASLDGNIFDHFHCAYEYPDNVVTHLGCRQQTGCSNENSDVIRGTKGALLIGKKGNTPIIEGENAWRFRGKEGDMYQNEHNELFASIRAGEPINDGEWMTHSTKLAIMGRIAAYTGQRITWEDIENPHFVNDLAPDDLAFDDDFEPTALALPGRGDLWDELAAARDALKDAEKAAERE